MKRKRFTGKAAVWRETVASDKRVARRLHFQIRSISDLTCGRKVLVDRILFEGADILRCFKGRFRFTFHDQRRVVDLLPDEALVTYPGQFVSIEALDRENKLVYGVFEGRDVARYFDEVGFFDLAKGKTEPHYESIAELKRQIGSLEGKSSRGRRKCLVYLTDILKSQVQEMRESNGHVLFDAIREIKGALKNGRCLPVAELCEKLQVSRVYLHRVFVAAGLGAPSDYQRDLQQAAALRLMSGSELSIEEVARRTGFLSTSHFSTFIKRRTGKSPHSLRQ